MSSFEPIHLQISKHSTWVTFRPQTPGLLLLESPLIFPFLRLQGERSGQVGLWVALVPSAFQLRLHTLGPSLHFPELQAFSVAKPRPSDLCLPHHISLCLHFALYPDVLQHDFCVTCFVSYFLFGSLTLNYGLPK